MMLIDNAYDYSWDSAYVGNFCDDLQNALDCVTTATSTYTDGFLADTTYQTCDDYISSIDTGLCTPSCADTSVSNDYTVSWCETCTDTTADGCFTYMQNAAQDVSTSCTDFQTGLSCLVDLDYFTNNALQCSNLVANLPSSCSFTCPNQCSATCNYRSCDEIIEIADAITCAQIENTWECDCAGCSCSTSASDVAALGYSSVIGTACYFTLAGFDTNRANIESLSDATFMIGTVDECANVCDDESTCNGFSYNLATEECTFVIDPSRLSEETNGDSMCLAKRTNTGSTTSTTTTTQQYQKDDNIENAPENVGLIAGVIVGVVVVGVIVGVVVWKVKDNSTSRYGFSPQNSPKAGNYAAPAPASGPASNHKKRKKKYPSTTPAAIDEDKQIDQDHFEL
jgi:hypothetical protein